MVYGEITLELLLMVGEEVDESSRVVVPLVLPWTVSNCDHLDAQCLVQNGTDTRKRV